MREKSRSFSVTSTHAVAAPSARFAALNSESVSEPAAERDERSIECGRDDLRVMLRTDYVVYFRCEHCRTVWSVAKPGEQFGT
jgi:hypothetical protein